MPIYENLYQETAGWNPKFYRLASIGEDECRMLQTPFEKEEITQVVKNFQGDKSPSPDGVTMAFFQHCWRVVAADVFAVFEEFHKYCKFEKIP